MNDSFSVIEDLTPEPPEKPGSSRWRDIALGLILLVLVVGFAGWQWWHQEYQASSYRAGQDALADRDWEAARDYFAAASGYLDADALVIQATEEIQRRETLYEQGQAFARDENWIAALQTLQELGRDRFDYRDTKSIWEKAQGHASEEALKGAVALRTDNDRPGLYVVSGERDVNPGGWRRLANSDSNSRSQGGCADGKILYDGPGSGWVPQPTPLPSPFYIKDGREKLEGRDLMAYDPNSPAAESFKVDVDPAAYDLFLCGRTGMWLYNYGPRGFGGLMPELADTPVREVETGFTLTYQSFDSPISATFTFPDRGDTHRLPMSIDHNSDRMLLAEWSGEDPLTGLVDGFTRLRLYLLELDGTEPPRLIYQVARSGLQSAQISPDSRYVLVNTFTPIAGSEPRQELERLLLIDLEDISDPVLLAETTATFEIYRHNWLSSAFVREGVYAGKVIVSRFDGRNAILVSVIDPATSAALVDVPVTAFTTGTGRVSPMIWTVAQEDKHALTLVGHQGIRDGLALIGWSLAVVSFSPEGKVTVTRDNTKMGYLRTYPFQIAKDRLIYVTDFSNEEADWTVWSMPLNHPANNGATSASSQIFSLRYPVPRTFLPYDKVSLGPALLAYTQNEELHVRSYDGKYDVVLDKDTLALYDTWRYWWYDNPLR